MPARRPAPSTTPLQEPVDREVKEPTRETLLTALAERERELAEALERETATAEILRVISQSPTDARPVFERIVLTAARVLKCDLAAALLCDGDAYWPAASANAHGLLPDFVPAFRVPIDPNANFRFARNSQQDDAALARLVADRRAPARAGGPGPHRRQFLDLPAAAARGRMHRCARLDGNPAQQLRSQGDRAGRVLSRPGADRDRERAAVPRNAGGAGAAEGFRGRAGRDQQVGLRHSAGVRGDPRRLPAPVRRRRNRHLHDRRRRHGARRRRGAARGPRRPCATSLRSPRA